MNRAVAIMAVIAAVAAIGGIIIVTRPSQTEQAVYIKRIAGTMAFAMALILTLFAWGLERILAQ